ncbi:MAG TPA: arginine--tRNA ligase [candidate division Zixibacteria bacterium]|nr:arginine--tRNA ligase [candidate division Zixibacteria bacterium]
MKSNPKTIIISSIENSLTEIFIEMKIKGKGIVQEVSKRDTFGDYCTPIFQIASQNKKNPIELAQIIAEKFPQNEFISKVVAERGFVNYELNRSLCIKKILADILENENFFVNDHYKGKKIIVEHTSANPNGPIHIGNFRGSIIGDVFARILKTCSAEVQTNFYIDDLGHQVPVCALGYRLLEKYAQIPVDIKIDHLLGRIYGITHTMYDIQKIKKELQTKYKFTLGKDKNWISKNESVELEKFLKKEKLPENEINDFKKRLEFLFKVQSDIFKRFKKLYDTLKASIEKDGIDLTVAVPDLNRRYMTKDEEAYKIVRFACEEALRGQREELALLGIYHDNFDWEADLQWSGEVEKAMQQLEKNDYIIKDGKAKLFDANKAANLKGAREYLRLKSDYEIPKAILVTSTGDTLYLLRDIAYSLKKVDHYSSDKVFNVIGKQQELAQRQLNLAVRAINRDDAANKMWHLNYEYMELKGALTSMSARRLQYITPLEIYEETKKVVLENFLKDREYSEKEKDEIATIVTVGAIKYSIIAIGLMRKMIFNPEEVISLSNNTSTFIQYAYARSQNILAKTSFKWQTKDSQMLESLTEDEEWSLVLKLTQLSDVILSAADQIKPELICNYLFEVANLFNKFYDIHRVLEAETKELVVARLALTYASGQILKTGLSILGIESPKRM